MRYRAAVILIIIGVALIAFAVYQTAAPPPEKPSMARLMPRGAVVFLEARDLSALLRDWNASPEKQAWLASANYQAVSRSRLVLRLQQVQGEFAAAAGIPPDYAFLSQVAGQHSALGLYDIGKLELLYVTKLPSASAMQSALWQKRSQFEPRQVEGRQFFVRTEPQSGRVIAFAIVDDYFILGTREDLVAGAVSALAGKQLANLAGESWFTTTVKAAEEPAELRMVIHLAEVTRTPQFRTYWIQQNVTAMRQYESSLSDLFRAPGEYREERVLLPKSTAEAADDRAVPDLIRLVPPDAGLYRASATPAPETALALLERKILTPCLGPASPPKTAPGVSLGEGTVGSESNLEVRIDVPPSIASTSGQPDDALKALLEQTNLRGALELHRSDPGIDGVFIRLRSAVVLSAATDWNEPAARAAVQRIISPTLTAAQLGTAWKPAGAGAQAYAELDGLAPVFIAVRGKYLLLSNDAAMLTGVLGRMREPTPSAAAIYAAGFNHTRERQDFYRLTALVDRQTRSNELGGPAVEPEFLSQNVASLSRVFSNVKSQTVVTRRSGNLTTQTVKYEWSR